MTFLKYFFIIKNKTGCRFLIVDAYNTPRVIKFYKKNKFILLTEEDKNKKTRSLYIDLINYHEAIQSNPESKKLSKKIEEIIENF